MRQKTTLGVLGGALRSAEEAGKPRTPESPGSRPGAEGLTQHVGRAVAGHEARVVPVARALLKQALTEVLAEAAARRHQSVVAAATAAAARPGVGLRQAAEDGAGHQPPVRQDREHRRRRPPEEARGPGHQRTPRPGAGSLLSRSSAAGAFLRAARTGHHRPCPPHGASHTLRRTRWSQSEVRAGGFPASAKLGSRLQPPQPPPSSAPLACSGPRRQRRPLFGPAPGPPPNRGPSSSPAPSGSQPNVVIGIELAQRVWARSLLGVVVQPVIVALVLATCGPGF